VSQAPGESGTAKWRTHHHAGSSADRHHSRFGVILPVRCTLVTRRVSRTWRGHTANVSGGGLAVDLPARVPPRTRVTIEIRTGIGPLRMEADVRWTRRVAGRVDVTRHGLCLAGRSEVMDLPIHALLGQWLQSLARQEAKAMARREARRRTQSRRRTRK